MTRIVQLSRSQWLVIAVFIAVAFPLITVIAFMPSVAEWYAVTTLAPGLERDLGFRTTIGEHPLSQRHIFFITEVKPGGAFDRAGVKPGDVPVGVHHGKRDFYQLLHAGRGGAAQIQVLRLERGLSHSSVVEHAFEVQVPKSAA